MNSPADTTIVYLVRHGETEWNADGRCQGRGDSEFTDEGRRQLRDLADALAAVEFDAAYTSPLVRARRTAAAALAGRRLRAASLPELVELDYGDLQGTRFDRWPTVLRDAWRDDPWSVRFPNGESLGLMRQRIAPIFSRIVAAHSGEVVLVSAHGHVNRLILLDAFDRPPEDFWRLEQPNGAVTRIECSVRVPA